MKEKIEYLEHLVQMLRRKIDVLNIEALAGAPNWNEAPPWAAFAAMDNDGTWYWFEKRPMHLMYSGVWSCEGKMEKIYSFLSVENTLTERPMYFI